MTNRPDPQGDAELRDMCAAVEADAVSALRYIERHHGRLSGVGWDRVFDAHDKLFARARELGLDNSSTRLSTSPIAEPSETVNVKWFSQELREIFRRHFVAWGDSTDWEKIANKALASNSLRAALAATTPQEGPSEAWQQRDLTQKLADALIADESSDLKPEWLREALLVALSKTDMLLAMRSASQGEG